MTSEVPLQDESLDYKLEPNYPSHRLLPHWTLRRTFPCTRFSFAPLFLSNRAQSCTGIYRCWFWRFLQGWFWVNYWDSFQDISKSVFSSRNPAKVLAFHNNPARLYLKSTQVKDCSAKSFPSTSLHSGWWQALCLISFYSKDPFYWYILCNIPSV